MGGWRFGSSDVLALVLRVRRRALWKVKNWSQSVLLLARRRRRIAFVHFGVPSSQSCSQLDHPSAMVSVGSSPFLQLQHPLSGHFESGKLLGRRGRKPVVSSSEVLPKLSSQTLHDLLTSDELWVPNEKKKRFELVLYTLLAKGALPETDNPDHEISSSEMGGSASDSFVFKGKNMAHTDSDNQLIESEFRYTSIISYCVY